MIISLFIFPLMLRLQANEEPYRWYAQWGKSDEVTPVLEQPADIHATLRQSVIEDNFDRAKMLIAAGADPHAQDSDGRTSLALAHSAAMIQLLLYFGVDVRGGKEHSALWKAISREDLQSIDLLLSSGAKIKNYYLAFGEWRGSTESDKLLKGASKFLKAPLSEIHDTITLGKNKPFATPQRLLLWSIAYKKNDAYLAIKALKPAWFTRPTILIKLFLNAARVDNRFATRDLYDLLKAVKIAQPTCKLIELIAIRYLLRSPEFDQLTCQIIAESLESFLLGVTI